MSESHDTGTSEGSAADPSADQPPDDTETPRDLDREETWQDAGTSRPRSVTFRAVVYVLDHVFKVFGALVLVVAAYTFFTKNPIPRTLRIAGLTFLLLTPTVGRFVGSRARDWLWDPRWIYVVDLDARTQHGAIYRWPSQQFRLLEVTDGSLDWLAPHLAVGKNVDMQEGTLEGTWRGSLSDRELLVALQKVEECRGQLEEDAKRGFAIEAQAGTIVRSAARRTVLHVVSTFETLTLPDDGEALGDEIDKAIESFGLEDKIRDLQEEPDPESDVPGVDFDEESSDLLNESDGETGPAAADGGAG